MANKKQLQIPLEKCRERLDYNPETGIFTWKDYGQKFNRHLLGREAGSIYTLQDGNKYKVLMFNKKRFYAHRVAYVMVTGKQIPNDHMIDHINHNGLDNRFENLRLVSSSDNSKNKGLQHNSKTGVAGVTWSKAAKKWQIFITVDRERKYLGTNSDFDEAVKIRKAAEKKYGFFGESGEKIQHKTSMNLYGDPLKIPVARAQELFDYDQYTGVISWKYGSGHHHRCVGDEAGKVDGSNLYRLINIDKRHYKASRVAFVLFHKRPIKDGHDIYNIDGDEFNISIENLSEEPKRLRSNKKVSKNNKSGLKGVLWNKKKLRWRSIITIDGKQKGLYSGKDFFEAVCARKSAENQNF